MNLKSLIMTFILVPLLNSTSNCEDYDNQGYLYHGTVIVASVCEDGILFASDSRSSFTLNEKYSNQVYAYFDNDKKIFEIGKFLIAFSGISMLNKKFMKDIVAEFNAKYPRNYDIETTLNKFIDYLKDEQRVPDSTLSENQIIIAGYEDSKPKIVAQNKGSKMYQEKIGYMIHSDTELPRFLNLSRDVKLTCKNLSPFMEKGIYSLAQYRNDNKVGGPLEIIQITPTNDHINLKSFKENVFKNYREMAEAILNDKIEVKYIFPISEELLKKTLKEGIELGY